MFGGRRVPEVFSPYGTMPAFKIATSHFSFVQIAPVADEIKKLGRDPARSLIGGVLFVGTLYRRTTFVSTSLMGGDQLAELGETGVVNTGRSIAGPFGAVMGVRHEAFGTAGQRMRDHAS